MNARFYFLFAFCLYASGVFGQSVSIQVTDKASGESLPGVNIRHSDKGYVTDENGLFVLDVSVFPIKIELSYVGYKSLSMTFESDTALPQTILMESSDKVLDLVTVTGSKYEQDLAGAQVSIDIIKSDLLRSVNSVSSDDILNKVAGVQVLDGQANIRGGSGYSYGAGSRVMLLIDDIPALQPDAGFPNWSDIPIENVSQIEVLKGAASTLYGSAALNGIINFRSSYATSRPETRASASSTFFLSPKDEAKKWWGDTIRYEANASFMHKRKIDKLDLIVSGMFNQLRGFNQFTNERRGRGNVNLRYRASEKLTFQLSTMVNAGESNSFFIWANPGSGAMRPLRGTVSDRNAFRLYVDPSITYTDKHKNRHRLFGRTIWVDNKNNTNQSNRSLNHYGEYQFQRNLENLGLLVTAGAVAAWSRADSEILGDTTFYARNNAVYIQLDRKIGEKLTLAGGLRYEYVAQNSPEVFLGDTIPGGRASDGQLIGRLSGNYRFSEYSSLRASFGQGYRYPTLTERFVTTTFGGFSIFANPSLQPEFGWSTELGWKQGFALGLFRGYVDVAAFLSTYQDMIEFTFVLDGAKVGFQPQNIGDTQIAGYEASVTGLFTIGSVPVQLLGGYTYIDPTYRNYETSEEIRNSVSEPLNVLKYRSKHLFKIDAEAKIGIFSLGTSLQRASHVVNIDKAFESVPPVNIDLFGIGQYRDLNNRGFWLLDARLRATLGKITLTALVNNILNEEYTLRPALIEAPRNVGLRLDYLLE